MTPALDEVAAALAAEIRHLEGLLELLREEERVLRQADTRALAAVTSRKEAWIRERVVVERARRQAVSRAARALQLDPAAITLSDLARRAPAQSRRFLDLREELRGLTDQLSECAERNGFLIERSLRHLRTFVATLVQAVTQTATYTAGGRSGPEPGALGLIDRRA
jgi:flagellar biosynthesis/type III secretory pathway chaperone